MNPRKTPTVLNAALQFIQHWRGDRTSVEDQATKALTATPSFGNPTSQAAYERTLLTPSRFDAFLTGDDHALPVSAQAGLRTFIDVGCVRCHNGVEVGGGMYQRFGLVEDYWKATGTTAVDKGRFDVTHAGIRRLAGCP